MSEEIEKIVGRKERLVTVAVWPKRPEFLNFDTGISEVFVEKSK